MDEHAQTKELVERYFRSWQERDWRSLRECLADDIHFDWGIETYTDPEVFVAAADSGIEWRDVHMLASLFAADAAMIVYEGFNATEGIRLRSAEYLTIEADRLRTAVAVFAVVGD